MSLYWPASAIKSTICIIAFAVSGFAKMVLTIYMVAHKNLPLQNTILSNTIIYLHCLAGQTVFPVQITVKMKIPLIIWGHHQGLDQVGMFSHLDEVEMSGRHRRNNDLLQQEAEAFINERNPLISDPTDIPMTRKSRPWACAEYTSATTSGGLPRPSMKPFDFILNQHRNKEIWERDGHYGPCRHSAKWRDAHAKAATDPDRLETIETTCSFRIRRSKTICDQEGKFLLVGKGDYIATAEKQAELIC